jgi:hypothetical protein
MNMINRLGAIAAVNTALMGECVECLSPASHAKFWAQILKENRIPGVHPIGSVVRILPAVTGLSMYRGMLFVELDRRLAGCAWVASGGTG